MSDVLLIQQKFIEALNALAAGQSNPQELKTTLREALLDFGSATPDNLNCANRVEVGRVGPHTGLKITGREALFSDISHALEAEPMPSGIKEQFPQISEKDWDAFTRMTTLIYILLSPKASFDQ